MLISIVAFYRGVNFHFSCFKQHRVSTWLFLESYRGRTFGSFFLVVGQVWKIETLLLAGHLVKDIQSGMSLDARHSLRFNLELGYIVCVLHKLFRRALCFHYFLTGLVGLTFLKARNLGLFFYSWNVWNCFPALWLLRLRFFTLKLFLLSALGYLKRVF